MEQKMIIRELKRILNSQGYRLMETTKYSTSIHNSTHEYIIEKHLNDIWLTIQNVKRAVPDIIKKLKNIESITIRSCSFDIDWISEIEGLRMLAILNCQYQTLPDEFSGLKSLTLLQLYDSGLLALPSCLKDMDSLDHIVIQSSKKYFKLPDWISQLKKLKTLCLDTSLIHSIPSDLLNTKMKFVVDNNPAEEGIKLFGTTLEQGDISLFGQTREIIEAYYAGKQKAIRECKVIFLGEGKSGKSSLIERVVNDTFVQDKLPTDGIMMQTWEQKLDGESIRLRLLDFGGQEIMHAMHRCFMTQHTVYVLVCESRADGDIDREAARWLENIKEFAYGCPVILALNKADLNSNASVNETNLKKINQALRLPVLRTSAKLEKKKGTDALIRNIFEATREIISNTYGNEGIITLKQKLETMQEDYISDNTYRNICYDCGVTNEVGNNILEWFKELGVCYYYTASELDTSLEGLRVLNPAWLTNGIYRLLLKTRENGILSHAEIKDVLRATSPQDAMPDKIYTKEETEFILHVMRKFEISHNMGNGRELIPLKMGKSTPARVKKFDKELSLHISWEAGYIPNTVVHRLMIRKYDELNQSCMWREGASFESRNKTQRALVEMMETRLDVYVQAIDKRQYMEEFRKCLLDIFLDLNLQPKEMVHFEWEEKEHSVLYSEVLELYHRGREEVYVAGAMAYPHPGWILHEHYVEEKGRAQMMIKNSKVNVTYGDNSPIATQGARQFNQQNIARDGINAIGQTISLEIDQLKDNISKRSTITQVDFDILMNYLDDLSKQRIPFLMKRKIRKVVRENRDKTASSSWHKIRDFLTDGATLATIATFGLTYGKSIMDYLQKIFSF